MGERIETTPLTDLRTTAPQSRESEIRAGSALIASSLIDTTRAPMRPHSLIERPAIPHFRCRHWQDDALGVGLQDGIECLAVHCGAQRPVHSAPKVHSADAPLQD